MSLDPCRIGTFCCPLPRLAVDRIDSVLFRLAPLIYSEIFQWRSEGNEQFECTWDWADLTKLPQEELNTLLQIRAICIENADRAILDYDDCVHWGRSSYFGGRSIDDAVESKQKNLDLIRRMIRDAWDEMFSDWQDLHHSHSLRWLAYLENTQFRAGETSRCQSIVRVLCLARREERCERKTRRCQWSVA